MALQEESLGAELASLQSRPFTNKKHLARHKQTRNKQKNPTTKAEDCWAATILQEWGTMWHSSNWSRHLLDLYRKFLKEALCHTVVNITLFQLFWEVLLPTNLKLANNFLLMIKCLTFNILDVVYGLLWINHGLMRFSNHCIFLLFMFYISSQLLWNLGCTIHRHLFRKHYASFLCVLFQLLDLEIRKTCMALESTDSVTIFFSLETMNSWSL